MSDVRCRVMGPDGQVGEIHDDFENALKVLEKLSKITTFHWIEHFFPTMGWQRSPVHEDAHVWFVLKNYDHVHMHCMRDLLTIEVPHGKSVLFEDDLQVIQQQGAAKISINPSKLGQEYIIIWDVSAAT